MYLFFRSESKDTKLHVLGKLKNTAAQFEKADFKCIDSQEKACQDEDIKTVAFVVGHQNPIYICYQNYIEASNYPFTLIHEAMHLFNRDIIDYGYFEKKKEGIYEETTGGKPDKTTVGDPPSERLNNADSYACFVMMLVDSNLSGDKAEDSKQKIQERADAYRGKNLVIQGERLGSEVNLYPEGFDDMTEFVFYLNNIPKASGFTYKWQLILDNGKIREPRELAGKKVTISHIVPELKEKDVKKAIIGCQVTLYRGGSIKKVSEHLKFDHSGKPNS